MRGCIYPGSFDPITCGHLDLIRRLASMYDKVTVTVMINRAKAGCIPSEERVKLIRKACAGIRNVDVELWHGLLADYAAAHPGSVIARGIRNASDFEAEMTAAAVNRRLNPGMETVFLPASDKWGDVSSSAVREIASFGGDYTPFVPGCIRRDLKKWLKPVKEVL